MSGLTIPVRSYTDLLDRPTLGTAAALGSTDVVLTNPSVVQLLQPTVNDVAPLWIKGKSGGSAQLLQIGDDGGTGYLVSVGPDGTLYLENGSQLKTDGSMLAGSQGGSGYKFQVNSSGNVVRINDVATSFPSSQGAAGTLLLNDGSGNLSWSNSLSALSVGDLTGGAFHSPDNTHVGFFGATPALQQSLTDSTGGSAGGTLSACGDTTSSDQSSTINSNFATIYVALHAYGLL